MKICYVIPESPIKNFPVLEIPGCFDSRFKCCKSESDDIFEF